MDTVDWCCSKPGPRWQAWKSDSQACFQLLLIARDCLHQTGHKEFEFDEREIVRFLIILTKKEKPSLWGRPGSHFCMHGEVDKKWTLARLLEMESVENPRKSVFIRHAYLQLAVNGWTVTRCLCYHTFIVTKVFPLKDSLRFAYGASLTAEGAEGVLTNSVPAASDRTYGAEEGKNSSFSKCAW